MPSKRVNTATLIRGKVLSFRIPAHMQKTEEDKEPIRFEANKPKVIKDNALLALLENTHEEVVDGEGEVYEKPTYKVERNVPEPSDDERSHVKRLSSTRTVKKRRVKRK